MHFDILIILHLDVHAGEGCVTVCMSNFGDSVTAVMMSNSVIMVTRRLTCIAKAFRATETGPFSASQAAISEDTKSKPYNGPLF